MKYWVSYLHVSGWWSFAVNRHRAQGILHFAHDLLALNTRKCDQCVRVQKSECHSNTEGSTKPWTPFWIWGKDGLGGPQLELVQNSQSNEVYDRFACFTSAHSLLTPLEYMQCDWLTMETWNMQYFNTVWLTCCAVYCDKSADLTLTPLPYLYNCDRGKCSPTPKYVWHLQNKHMTYLLQGLCSKSAWMKMPSRSNLHVFALHLHNG